MQADMIPLSPGYVSVGSRRYQEWQTLAFEATTGKEEEVLPVIDGLLVDHPYYPTPKQILKRPSKDTEKTVTEEEEAMQKCDVSIGDHQGKQ